MTQTRICQRFRAIACPHVSARSVNFTDLPQAIRRRIYDYAFAAKIAANPVYGNFDYISIDTIANRLSIAPSFLPLFSISGSI